MYHLGFLLFVLSLASFNSDPRVASLIDAAMMGDLGKTSELLRDGTNVDGVALEGWTPLTRACEAGNLEVVTLLVAHGADINRGTGDIPSRGMTPLFLAAFGGHVDVVQFLITRGARLDLQPGSKDSFLSRVRTFKNPSLDALVSGVLPP